MRGSDPLIKMQDNRTAAYCYCFMLTADRLESLDAGYLRRLADHVLVQIRATESWTCRCQQRSENLACFFCCQHAYAILVHVSVFGGHNDEEAVG